MNVRLWTEGTTQCGQNIYIATLLTPALPDMKQTPSPPPPPTSTVPSGAVSGLYNGNFAMNLAYKDYLKKQSNQSFSSVAKSSR
jgi:hypothetical protein